MTSRERVIKALNFEEPDRVPLDLSSTNMTGIMAHALDRLRKHLGLEQRTVKVYDLFQMLGEVEMDMVEELNLDILPVLLLTMFFGIRNENYKPWKLFDGTEVLVPGQFSAEDDGQGYWLLHHQGDLSQPVEGRMPKQGYYFDILSFTESHFDFKPPPLEEIKKENHITTQALEYYQQQAERLRKDTDKALFLNSFREAGLPFVGSIPDFLCLLGLDQQYVKDMFAIGTETSLSNLEKLKTCLGDKIEILGLDGFDYGSQKAELLSPDWFAEFFVPFLKQRNDWVHENTNWKTWQHSCGSITKILPMLVESGLDILNPVQCSAEGMDPKWLKETFGKKLVFWGGGVDTQKTLPFGTAEEVQKEVAQRIEIFAPGGGFVFNAIHNIQHGTAPENIVAAYKTAFDKGHYPITK